MLQSIQSFWNHDGLILLGQRISDFAHFLLGGTSGEAGIRFFYFDVKNRELGEKMYVIINTCGAPMVVNEHIKPLLIGQLSDSKEQKKWAEKWEDWQDFFWINRKEKEDSADEGFNEFIQWFVMIREQSEIEIERNALNNRRPCDIYNYFVQTRINAATALGELEQFYTQVRALWIRIENPDYKLIFTQICQGVTNLRNLNPDMVKLVLLPLLALMEQFPDEHDWHALFLRRLRKNYFLKTRSPETKRGVDWRYLLQMIEKIPESGSWLEDIHRFADFTALKGVDAIANDSWFDEEEKIKDVLFPERHQLATGKESSLWQWEDHEDFVGDITPLLRMCQWTDADNGPPVLRRQYFEERQRQELLVKLGEYYHSYLFFEGLMDGQQVEETKDPSLFNLANHYRLFKLLIGCQTIGNLYRCQFDGVAFSPKGNRVHLNKGEFLRLCRDGKSKLLDYSKAKIRETLPYLLPLTREGFIPQKTLPLWFILKVLKAESEKALLTYHDGNAGYAAYGSTSEDQIFPGNESDIRMANLLCGLAIKAGFGKESRVECCAGDDPAKLNTPLIKIEERLFISSRNPDFCEADKVALRQQIEAGETGLEELLRPYHPRL